MVVRSYSFNLADPLIVIEHFENYPEMSTGVDKSFARDLGASLALDLQRNFGKKGVQRPRVILPGEQVIGDLLIRGRITRASGGDRFYRMTFGLFGNGASEVQAMGEVIDVKTATSLLAFSITRRSEWSWAANENAVRGNIEEISEALVKIILQSKE